MDFEEPWRLYSGYNVDAIPQQISELFTAMFYNKEIRLSNGWDDLAAVIKEKFDAIQQPSSNEAFFNVKNYFYKKEISDLIRFQIPVASLERKDYLQLAQTYIVANKQGFDLFADAGNIEARNRENELVMSRRVFEANNNGELVQKAKEKGELEANRNNVKVERFFETL